MKTDNSLHIVANAGLNSGLFTAAFEQAHEFVNKECARTPCGQSVNFALTSERVDNYRITLFGLPNSYPH